MLKIITSKWRSTMSAIFITLVSPVTLAHNSSDNIESFPLSQVRITGGPMAHAQQVNVQYLLKMDPDRLLAPFLREAGITPKANSYGNWESSGLDGHIGGHYLTALSLAYAATGEQELKQRLDYMVDQLAAAQQKTGGYLSGIPNGLAAWQQIKRGEIKSDLFSLNDRWVPLYNIDKIYHGLRDAYEIGGNSKAKPMLISLTDWMVDLVKDLSDEQVQTLLYSEHGGLAQVFVDVAEITNNPKHLELARRFAHMKIIEPLLHEKDELTGIHANTQIPKILGMLQYAEHTGNNEWIDGAKYFWQTVTGNRSVSIGGNSVREHFHASDDFTAMVEDVEGPETCNTYNMMKLSLMLFKLTGDAKYFEFYERANYNHILSSQHPEHGGLVYFTSMRPGHYRMYSSVEDSMWCCVGSGIENHSKYGEMIYAKQGDALLVNMFVPSTLQWPTKGLTLQQTTNFPDDNHVKLTIKDIADEALTPIFPIKLRQPAWLESAFHVTVNDKAVRFSDDGDYLTITRQWRRGDQIEFTLAPKLYAEQLPDGQSFYSLQYGPVVLATKIDAFKNEQLNFIADDSRMGHIAAGPTCPPEAVPIMLAEPEQFVSQLKKNKTGPLSFVATQFIGTVADNSSLNSATLIPFFRLHDARYQVYWPQLSESEFNQYAVKVKKQAAQDAELAAITVDKITPGQQQPEVEHNFKGENTRAGVNNGHHWRDAFGWFSYELKNPELAANTLRLKFFKHDVNRQFTVTINGLNLTDIALPALKSEQDFYEIDFQLSPEMKQAKVLTLKFQADENSVAGGIYGIRLLK